MHLHTLTMNHTAPQNSGPKHWPIKNSGPKHWPSPFHRISRHLPHLPALLILFMLLLALSHTLLHFKQWENIYIAPFLNLVSELAWESLPQLQISYWRGYLGPIPLDVPDPTPPTCLSTSDANNEESDVEEKKDESDPCQHRQAYLRLHTAFLSPPPQLRWMPCHQSQTLHPPQLMLTCLLCVLSRGHTR